MEESTLILAKKIAEQGLTDDADAAEAFDGSPKPLRKMQGKLQGFRWGQFFYKTLKSYNRDWSRVMTKVWKFHSLHSSNQFQPSLIDY